MNKIAVYTICKNEEKFVNKWLDSMSEADYMVVLDTGSTDATIKLLEEGKRKRELHVINETELLTIGIADKV